MRNKKTQIGNCVATLAYRSDLSQNLFPHQIRILPKLILIVREKKQIQEKKTE